MTTEKTGVQAGILAVILDVDGTLVDSNDAHASAWLSALQAYGYDVTFDNIRPLIGMGGDNLLPAAVQVTQDSEIGQEIAKERRKVYKTVYLPNVKAFPKVRELVAHLQQAGLQLIAASSGEESEVEANLHKAGVEDLVTDYTSSDDVENSKPEPDILEAALEKLGCSPKQAVMIGDSPYDIQAAQKLGLPIIALRCGGFSDDVLADATAIYDDPADLLAHFAESPLGQRD
ncbi:MAG: HAD family hydrolase [Anaerolineae bacterium]